MSTDFAAKNSRVDAHQHFWQIARGDYRWMDPKDPGLAPIVRDFFPADMAPLRQATGVVQTVLVQAADSTAETDFMLSLAAQHPEIAGVVGWVDVSDPGSISTLERWAALPGAPVKSIRPMLQDLPDHDWIAHRPHPDVIRALLRLGIRFDALVKPWHLAGLLKFVDAWPDLPVVIDHAAKPQMVSGWGDDRWVPAWTQGMKALALRPQLVCKWSGLLTEAGGVSREGGDASEAILTPVWDLLLAHFGPKRLMWGSDWPVLNLAADYGRWVSLSDRFIDRLSVEEQAAVRARTARFFYGLDYPG